MVKWKEQVGGVALVGGGTKVHRICGLRQGATWNGKATKTGLVSCGIADSFSPVKEPPKGAIVTCKNCLRIEKDNDIKRQMPTSLPEHVYFYMQAHPSAPPAELLATNALRMTFGQGHTTSLLVKEVQEPLKINRPFASASWAPRGQDALIVIEDGIPYALSDRDELGLIWYRNKGVLRPMTRRRITEDG